ncbi:hypothetical protein BZA77DRAFT_41828 [Pyronema omphalodes]|nr:hypothetical protein BZA77DRAFT_41828 [Pyronema omphalodes]
MKIWWGKLRCFVFFELVAVLGRDANGYSVGCACDGEMMVGFGSLNAVGDGSVVQKVKGERCLIEGTMIGEGRILARCVETKVKVKVKVTRRRLLVHDIQKGHEWL